MTTRSMPSTARAAAGAKSAETRPVADQGADKRADEGAARTVAEFSIRHHQLLNPAGQPTAPLPEFARKPAELLKMYRMMTLARTFDTKAINLQRTGKLGTYASCLGHEATHVGAGAAMRPEDVLVPFYREYGAQFWRGVKMSEVLLYWGGDERASNFSQARKDFPWCVPIATQMLHGAGVAMAMKIRGEKRCALAFIGDGGTSEGAFYEALNLAGARSLPVVFVTVNNKWAISVPIESQTACATLAQKAIAAGIPGVQVDGNDAIAVRQVISQALGIARNGGGPALVEALTYRLSDHTTADDATRYRPTDEVKAAWKLEPLLRLRQYLTDTGAWSQAQEEELQAECAREVQTAVEEYLNAPKPTTGEMFDHLFANMPRHLQAQREDAIRHARHRAATGGSH
jgi:pyruvate dehydrogenase E1 component alpha subunit